jgi:hypothetical protein
LLVGNAIFPDAQDVPEGSQRLVPLKGPPNDVARLAEALVHPELGIHTREDVRTLVDGTRAEMVEEVESFFADAKRDEQLLFYYSGHGILDVNNRLSICARDTRPHRLGGTALADSIISSMIERSPAQRFVIVLDCCHSGAFKDAGDVPPALQGTGRFVLMSGRQADLSDDARSADGMSVFTHFLVEGLLSGEVDANRDGYISLSELYLYVFGRVKEATRGQTPQRKFDDAVAELVIGRGKRASAPSESERSSGAPGRHPSAPPRSSHADQPPLLEVSQKHIELRGVKVGEKLPDDVVDVYNRGGGTLDWTVRCDADWCEAQVIEGGVKLHYRPQPGMNRANIYVRDRGRGGSQVVRVIIEVEQERPPRLELSQTSIDFGALARADKPSRQTRVSWSIRARNAGGGGDLALRASVDHPALEVEVHGDIVEVFLQTATDAGPVEGELTIESAGGNAVVPVTAVIELGPILSASPKDVDYGRVVVGRRTTQTVVLQNTGSRPLVWKAIADQTEGVELACGTGVPSRTLDGSLYSNGRAELQVHFTGNTPAGFIGRVYVESNGGQAIINLRAAVVEAPAPAPAPPAIEPPTAPTFPFTPPVGLAGRWISPAGTWVDFMPNGPQFVFREYNVFGMCVAEGMAAIAPDGTVRAQGQNMAFQPIEAVLTVQGNMLVGTARSLFTSSFVTYQRA